MHHLTDLADHPMAIFAAGESYVSPTERAWLKWVGQLETLLGGSADRNQFEDGYSLDYAYAAFEDGATPKQALDEFAMGYGPQRPR